MLQSLSIVQTSINLVVDNHLVPVEGRKCENGDLLVQSTSSSMMTFGRSLMLSEKESGNLGSCLLDQDWCLMETSLSRQ